MTNRDDAMIEIGEHTIGVWCVAMSGSDWLAHLRRQDDGTFEFVYRFRYHADDRVFDSTDRKSWTRVVTKRGEPETHAIDIARFTFHRLIGVTGASRHWELMRGERPVDDFLLMLGRLPGMHVKTYQVARDAQ